MAYSYRKSQGDFGSVLEKAIKILSLREHSKNELEKKLQARFENQEVITKVIQYCQEKDYVNNERYASLFIKQAQRKGKGKLWILQALHQKGISKNIALSFFSEDEIQEINRAYELAQKKHFSFKKDISSEKQKQKLAFFLKSKGYSSSIIFSVLDKMDF